MSSVLFDSPGPKARRRHRIYTAGFVVLLLVAAYFVVQRFRSEGVLTADVLNASFQNRYIRYMFEGLEGTLKAAALAIVASIIFGALLAIGRLSDHAVVRLPATLVIEFFRAVPLVLLILIVWFSFKDTIGTLGSLCVGLTLYNGSVLAEVFRAGVNAVATGQSEAAYAIGMRKSQVMRVILMPQAVQFMLPAIISQCVIVLKDSSLGFIIVFPELVRNSRQVALSVEDGTIVIYSTAALVFIVINYTLSKLAEYLQRRLSRRGGRVGPDVAADDQVPSVP
jgi:glutamate transport system permease protein